MNLLEALELSGDHFLQLVATLDSRQLEAASVCPGWLVGDVGRHVVSGCRMSVALADGCSAAEALAARDRPVGGPLASHLGEAIAQQLAALATDRPNGFVVHHPGHHQHPNGRKLHLRVQTNPESYAWESYGPVAPVQRPGSRTVRS